MVRTTTRASRKTTLREVGAVQNEKGGGKRERERERREEGGLGLLEECQIIGDKGVRFLCSQGSLLTMPWHKQDSEPECRTKVQQ